MKQSHMKKSRLILTGLAMLFLSTGVFAQKATITGKVADPSGAPISGVSVAIEGTNVGTVTDNDGSFALVSPGGFKADQTITFTSMGYKQVSEPVNSRSVIDVKMESEAVQMNDLVVVGYGTMRKAQVTSSISTVRTDVLPKSSQVSLGTMLAGRASGLVVTQTSAAPGAALNFSIRGSQNPPLIVIDGVPVNPLKDQTISTTTNESGTQLQSIGQDNSFTGINPEDIASIDILKDASATSIYGSRGANGVILITTKRGAEGKPVVAVSGSFSVQKLYGMPTMLSGADYMLERNKMTKELYMNTNGYYPYGSKPWNDLLESNINYPYSQADIDGFTGGTNWLNQVTRLGTMNTEQLSVMGGSSKTKYLFSMSNLGNSAVVKSSDFNRFTTRINLDQQFNKIVKGGVSLAYNRNSINNIFGGRPSIGSYAGTISKALEYDPLLSIRDADGNYIQNPLDPSSSNPVAFLDAKDQTLRQGLTGNAFLEVDPLQGLSVKASFGADLNTNMRRTFFPSTIIIAGQPSSQAYIAQNQNENYLFDLQADYRGKIGADHSYGVTGVFEFNDRSEFGTTMTSANFPSDEFSWNNMGAGTTTRPPTSYLQGDQRSSYIVRANYAFREKYMLNANLRVDGSSNFAADKQWGYFPGVSAAWRISQENFLQGNRILTNLKLRAGYGTVGNDGSLTGTNTYYSNTTYSFDKTPTTGIGIANKGNPKLSWETHKTFSVGVDWELLGGRVSGTVDAYTSRIYNIIGVKMLPISNEIRQMDFNTSEIDGNRGVDVSISSVNIQNKNFKWTSDFNLTWYRNYYIRRDPSYTLKVYEQQRMDMGGVWGYQIAGLEPAGNKNAGAILIADRNSILRDAAGNPILAANGQPQYANVPDGVIDDADITYFGNATPIPISLHNKFEYKNFDLDIFFNGMLNYYGEFNNSTPSQPVNNATNRFFTTSMMNVLSNNDNTLASLTNRWSYTNMNSTIPSIFATSIYGAGFMGMYGYQKAWFIRCSNVTLGYSFPKGLDKKIGISSARVYAAADNLFVITPYSGMDPEYDSKMGYPSSRTFTLGLQLKF